LLKKCKFWAILVKNRNRGPLGFFIKILRKNIRGTIRKIFSFFFHYGGGRAPDPPLPTSLVQKYLPHCAKFSASSYTWLTHKISNCKSLILLSHLLPVSEFSNIRKFINFRTIYSTSSGPSSRVIPTRTHIPRPIEEISKSF
jgi:hypothetical protein